MPRIEHLREAPAPIRFLSVEPLLGRSRRINLDGIDWVIVGGESGPGARPMEEEWVISIRDQCREQRVPFFFKQWGGVQRRQKMAESSKGRTLRHNIRSARRQLFQTGPAAWLSTDTICDRQQGIDRAKALVAITA